MPPRRHGHRDRGRGTSDVTADRTGPKRTRFSSDDCTGIALWSDEDE